ncbi:MAG TPA: cytochrome c peroxidase [Candidatus Elarobacter sp.]
MLPDGGNPHPVRLVRPTAAPLSALAQVGRRVFFDATLSSSGRLSCASCHSPVHAYGPPGERAVMSGGATLTREGLRAVPSLRYLERQPNFSIGPDDATDDERAKPLVPADASAAGLVPQGGLFWDGRTDTLQSQALEPLLNPFEMDGGSVERVAAKLRHAPYAGALVQLFGTGVLRSPRALVGEALSAVSRFQIEDPSFHPYASKYDAWLEGKARFTPAEARGFRLFNEPKGANCAGCHVDRPTPDGLPPLFTDHQYEALGVPRNRALAINRDPAFFDLGLCGPVRRDLRAEPRFCGMFVTPSLRNVATRRAFFHNGFYRTLRGAVDFYVYRPATIDDLPPRYRANVDVTDPPFGRPPGAAPVLTPADERDLIAFLRTLTDER